MPKSKRAAPQAAPKPNKKQKINQVETIEKVDAVPIDEGETVYDSITLVAGSYERILYGLEGRFTSESSLSLQPVFSFAAHLSCIKTLAACSGGNPKKSWLATGSTDENIKIWNLHRRKEMGSLMAHEGAVTVMRSVGKEGKYLVTASSDETLQLLRTKDWSVLRSFKGHKGRVNDVAVHPKGRIALSVGQDRTLRMWDLLGSSGQAAGGGKQGSSSTKLGAEGDIVRWNSKGDMFIVICNRELRLYKTDMTLLTTLESKSRFHDVHFFPLDGVNEELMAVACEDGKGRIYAIPTEAPTAEKPLQCVAELVGHTKRIKCIESLLLSSPASSTHRILSTISSDGLIHLYNLSSAGSAISSSPAEPVEVEPITQHDTKGSRLICLTTVGFKGPAAVDQESEGSDSEGSEGSESGSELPDGYVEIEGEEKVDGEEVGEEWGGIGE